MNNKKDTIERNIPLNVLLVEDNQADAVLMGTLMQETGFPFDLSLVDDGEGAIRFIKAALNGEHRFPDLILLDVNLPKKNGHEVLSFIRKGVKLTDICIVICSGSNSTEDIEKARQNLANAYLVKPMCADEMEATVINLKDILDSLSDGSDPKFWF